jgi:hypothetical protein
VAKPHTAVGITIVRAPGGGLVLVKGPMDLSKAESLSPVWTRELKETRPKSHLMSPDKENGRRAVVVAPTWETIGEVRVHGESAGRVAKRGVHELSTLLDDAVRSKDLPLDVLEALVPAPTDKKLELPQSTEKDAATLAERALGFIGMPDAEVRRRLLALGRRKSDVDRYLSQRKAAE